MATQASLGQDRAEPTAKKHFLAAPVVKRMTPGPQQSRRVADRLAEKRTRRATQHLADITAIGAGVALLAVPALFLTGFLRSRIERGFHRAVEKAEEIEIPLLLPITLMEAVRELLIGRRNSAATFANQPAVK